MKKSFEDSDPTYEERRSVEKNILKHMGQLSEDNIYILLTYAHDLLEEQLQEESREERIQSGKHLNSSEMSYQELLKFCMENNLFCFEYYQHRHKKN